MGKNLYPPGATFCKHCGYCLHALTVNRCPECGHEFDPANPKTFRARPPTSRLKWVVRAGVVLLLLAAVPMGYWGWLWWGWRQEQPVIARLTAKGATITTTVIGPDWVKRWMPEDAAFVLVRTKEVECYKLPVTDLDLQGLENLTELDTLAVTDALLTDTSLSAVGRLKHLKTLSLRGTPITDQGLASLKELRQLENLYVEGAAISGRGLEYLTQNSGMRILDLTGMQIGDESVEMILRFAKLEVAALRGTNLTDAGLLRLGRLPALKVVYIDGRTVTRGGLETLRKARPGLVLSYQIYRPPSATAPAE